MWEAAQRGLPFLLFSPPFSIPLTLHHHLCWAGSEFLGAEARRGLRVDSQVTLCKIRNFLPSFHRRRIRVLLGAAHGGALLCLPDTYKNMS